MRKGFQHVYRAMTTLHFLHSHKQDQSGANTAHSSSHKSYQMQDSHETRFQRCFLQHDQPVEAPEMGSYLASTPLQYRY